MTGLRDTSPPMHFGLIANPHSPHTQKWAHAIERAGHRVTVFSYAKGGPDGLTCVPVHPPRWLGPRLHYGWYLAGGAALRAALDEHEVDVMNAHNLTTNGVWAARAGGRPLASLAYGSEVFMLAPQLSSVLVQRHHGSASGHSDILRLLALVLRRPYFRRRVREVLRASGFVIGSNRVLTDALTTWFGVPEAHVQLNRWGVDPDRFDVPVAEREAMRRALNVPADRPLVVAPRGIRPLYQPDVILDAWERLLQRDGAPATFLLLSAGQTTTEAVREQIEQLTRRHANVRFVDRRLSRDEMARLWSLTDVFISAPIYDALSSVLYEGGYAGAVPVVNRTEATAEVFTHQETAWMVDPFDAAGLADALHTLLADLPTWQTRIARANRAWIEREALFPANVERFIAACERLCRGA